MEVAVMSEDTRGGAQDCLALVATSDTNIIECTSRAHQLNDASLIFLMQGTWMIVGAVLCGRPASNRKTRGNTKGGHRGPPLQLMLQFVINRGGGWSRRREGCRRPSIETPASGTECGWNARGRGVRCES